MKVLFISLLIFVSLADELWAKNGMLLEIKGGKSKELRVAANPTTGYQWHADSIANPYFKITDTGYHSATSDIPLVGAGGYETFLIEALKGCDDEETSVTLKYQRVWESDPVQTIKIGLEC